MLQLWFYFQWGSEPPRERGGHTRDARRGAEMGRQRDGLSPLAGGGLGTRLKFASSALEPHETLFHLTNKPPTFAGVSTSPACTSRN